MFNELKKATEFYRDIYFKCIDFIEDRSGCSKRFCGLLGPRKCGKTKCLEQLAIKYEVSIIDFSSLDEDEALVKLNEVCNAKEGIFLIDEITYLESYDLGLNKMASMIPCDSPIKVIITGSQAYAIRYFCEQSFATEMDYIETSFIDFNEWIGYCYSRYKSVDESKLLREYILLSREFTKITDNRNYLISCINETINSFNKAYCIPRYPTNIRDVSVDRIIGVFYSILFSLHGDVSLKRFRDGFLQLNNIRYFVRNTDVDINIKNMLDRINTRYTKIFGSIKNMKKDEFLIIVRFLVEWDLITITRRIDKLEMPGGDFWDLLADYEFEDIFENYIFCVKHPMFYSNIAEDVLKGYNVRFENIVGNDFIGSVYECIVRGYYADCSSSYYLYEYQSGKIHSGLEVDIVNFATNTLIEISVGKNHKNIFTREEFKDFDKVLVTDKVQVDTTDSNISYYTSYDYLVYLCKLRNELRY